MDDATYQAMYRAADAFTREMFDKVRREGYQVVAVGAGVDSPPFAYTMGRPIEFMVRGLDPRNSHWILSTLHELDPQASGEIDVGGEFPVRLDLTFELRDWGLAKAWHGEDPLFPRFVVKVPDTDGRWPEDPLCDPVFARAQKYP